MNRFRIALFGLFAVAALIPAQANADITPLITEGFETYNVGSQLYYSHGVAFNGLGTIQADGATENYLQLFPSTYPELPPLMALMPQRFETFDAGHKFYNVIYIYTVDVMFPTGGSVYWRTLGFGPEAIALNAGEWYQLDLNTPFSVQFLSAGGVSLDNLVTYQSISQVPETSTWMMMLIGFIAIGFALRTRIKGVQQHGRPVFVTAES